MSGGRLYTIRAVLGADVYAVRSMLTVEPVPGDLIEYAGAVQIGEGKDAVAVDLELEVLRRRIPAAGGAPTIDAVVTGGISHREAERALGLLRFRKQGA